MSLDTEILADNPLGYWKLDETSGTVATDSGSGLNNGTIAGTPALDNRSLCYKDTVGKSIDFDGVNDDIDFVNTLSTALNGATQITVEALFRPEDIAANRVILQVILDGTLSGLQLGHTSSGVRFFAQAQGPAPNSQIVSSADTQTHVIKHAVGVVDFAKGMVLLYVDGVLVDSLEASFAVGAFTVGTPTGADRIGSDQGGGSFFNGKIQNVAVYNTALAATRVRAHYRATLPYTSPVLRALKQLNPIGFWPLDETSGDALDWAGGETDLVNSGPTQAGTSLIPTESGTSYLYTAGSSNFSKVNLPAYLKPTITSFVAVVKRSSATAGVIMAGVPTGAAADARGMRLLLAAGGNISLQKGPVGAGSFETVTTVGTLAVGETGIVACSSDGSFIKVSLNAEEVSIASATVIEWADSGTGPSPAQLYIGGSRDNTAGTDANVEFLDAEVQACAFYDSLVSGQTVFNLMGAFVQETSNVGFLKVLQNLAPTLYYPFGEVGGSRAVDFSGNNLNAPYIGTITPGTQGNVHHDARGSTLFNGVDSRLTVGAVTDFIYIKNTQVYGISVNFKLNSLATDLQVIAGNLRNNGVNEGFHLVYRSTNLIEMTVASGGAIKTSATSPTVNDTFWHNLVVTCDNVNLTLYIDGVAGTPVAVGANGAGNNSFPLDVGFEGSGTAAFDGMLQYLAVSPATITAQGAKQIYEAYRSRYAAEVIANQPIGYWRMNEPSGSIIDYGSNNNVGTVNGGALHADSNTPVINESGHTSVLFDGVDDYLDMGSMSAEFTGIGTADYALVSWVRPTDIDLTSQIIMGWRTSTTSADDFTILNIDSVANELQAEAQPAGGGAPSLKGRVVTQDAWQFVAAVKLSSQRFASINGTLDNVIADTINMDTFVDQVFNIGRQAFSGSELHTAGQICETAVFDSTLTPEQLLDIYEAASLIVNTFLGFTGTITESLDITKWTVDVFRADTMVLLGSVDVDTSLDATYSADIFLSGYTGDCLLVFRVKTGVEWQASTAYSLGDYVIPTDTVTTPHLWVVTTAGTSGGAEPSWNLSGTTVDGTVTWTYVDRLVRSIVQGPMIPTP